ncbi:MAG: sensor histidine kinase [Gaiella sp.]
MSSLARPDDAAPGLARRRREHVSALTTGSALDSAHRVLRDGAHERTHGVLDAAHARAELVRAGAGHSPSADALAATAYVAEVTAELSAGGDLDAADWRVAVETLADATDVPEEVAALVLYERMLTSERVLTLPPRAAAEVQLAPLVYLGIADGVGLWHLDGGRLEPLLAIGVEATGRRARSAAKSALRDGGALGVVGAYGLQAAAVRRFGRPIGALVAQGVRGGPDRALAYLETAASALSPVLERELLLDRGVAREHALTAASEKRLVRLGFDLHDGPVQDVLALGAELTLLRDDVYPFIDDTRRELAAGRFDDLIARVTEIDGALRELAHQLESRSVTSRPLGEVLHRMVDEFSARSGIEAELRLRGDAESLTAAQRIAVFRALQESLTNVREHAGASRVEIELRARRQSIEVRIVDDGHGFDVERALARAAQRGRLGLVGMGERVRMLGGTFAIDSRPGGPTTVAFTLPRDGGAG